MRSRLVGLVVAAAALVAADTVLWLVGTRLLAARTAAWIAQAQGSGWSISTGDRTIGGWPFVAGLTIDRPAISGGERGIPGGLTWSADRIVLSLSPAHPLTLAVSAEGQQFLRLSHLPDIAFTASSATARLSVLDRHDAGGEFQAADIAAGIAGSSHPQDVQMASLLLRVRQDRASATPGATEAQAELRATGVGLPDIGRWPLGATVASAGTTLTVISPPLPDRAAALAPGQTPAAAQATAWRDGGGRIALRHAVLHWGPLSLNGVADLQLDDRLQPAGSMTADLAGTAAALDAATQGGLIPQGVALAAKAVLAVMPSVPGTDAIRVPFRLRDSTVSVGQIPLARLGDIGWGRPAR